MKTLKISTLLLLAAVSVSYTQIINKNKKANDLEYAVHKIESRIKGLSLAITHKEPDEALGEYPILLLHGATFPIALSYGYKMQGQSWMDNLTINGFDVYGLDFLGYGYSDRYPEMKLSKAEGSPLGRALEICEDVDKAVQFILKQTGKDKLYLLGHSWGGTVAALYATKHGNKVAKLILFATLTVRPDSGSYEDIATAFEAMTPEARINSMKKLTPTEYAPQLEDGVLLEWGNTWLASDPIAKEQNSPEVKFPSGNSQDIVELKHNKPYYLPSEIKVPVLVIRGEWDAYPNNSDAGTLYCALENAPYKKYVVAQKGTHVMHLEKNRFELYDEVNRFLKTGGTFSPKDLHDIAVIFEVIPNEGGKDEYLKLASELKKELEKIEGFVSIERFQSFSNPGKILSLSFWRNEEAIRQWRNLEMHRSAQLKGREYIFKDYRLRIAQVIRDYGMKDRKEAPLDSKRRHR